MIDDKTLEAKVDGLIERWREYQRKGTADVLYELFHYIEGEFVQGVPIDAKESER